MNWSFVLGALCGWMSFTEEGRAFGNKASAQMIKYIKQNVLNKDNENEDKRTL